MYHKKKTQEEVTFDLDAMLPNMSLEDIKVEEALDIWELIPVDLLE